MRVLGLPIEPPQAIVNHMLADLAAVARAARQAPAQLDRLLVLGEEIVAIGQNVLEVAERLDRRADAILSLGQRLDERGREMVELGTAIRDLGQQIDARGADIVDRASRVADTGTDLIAVLPTLERALELATPLEGAIDRFGRLVDRLPGGNVRRRGPVEPVPEPPAPPGGGDQAG